jgi:quercetin dioxygenase-like cupin family protein
MRVDDYGRVRARSIVGQGTGITHTFVYVLEGSIAMQVDGGRPVTLGPGQTFYESPSDTHAVSKNASASQPAKFLVFRK